MDKKLTLSQYEELSRARMKKLIDTYCNGSQQIFAERTGLNKASVSQYMNGKNTPSTKTAEKIAKAFGCSPEWVMGFADDDNGLSDGEKILISNYRKLSPIEKESIDNIIDKMANGADLDRVIAEKAEPETIHADKVLVVSSDGKRSKYVDIGNIKVTPDAPAPRKFNFKHFHKTPTTVHPDLKKISKKLAKRKKEG